MYSVLDSILRNVFFIYTTREDLLLPRQTVENNDKPHGPNVTGSHTNTHTHTHTQTHIIDFKSNFYILFISDFFKS
jgi:hypothetical protein